MTLLQLKDSNLGYQYWYSVTHKYFKLFEDSTWISFISNKFWLIISDCKYFQQNSRRA